MRELPGEFRKWISTLKSSNSAKPLADILSKKSNFINFNYTEFLETILDTIFISFNLQMITV
jgi:hypothetical protein